ncbi:Uncharacterised protein [Bordetella pertussis]|nr:Uncharacterised protein [Bordetella pertussis]
MAAGRAVHAQGVPGQRLPGGQGAADPRPDALEEDGPLGQLPREHVHDRVRKPGLRSEAHELPRARADFQCRPAFLSRIAAALRRVRAMPPQRTVRLAAWHDAGARFHPGRRPHFLYRRPVAGRVRRIHRLAAEGLQGLRFYRGAVQGRHASREAHRQRRNLGQGRNRPDGKPASYRLRIRDLAGRGRFLRPQGRIHAQGRHRTPLAVRHDSGGFFHARAAGRGVRRPERPASSAGHAAPCHPRFAGAFYRHADRKPCRCHAALAGPVAGGGMLHLRAFRRICGTNNTKPEKTRL